MIGGVSKMLPKRELGKVFHRRRSVCVWGGRGEVKKNAQTSFLKGEFQGQVWYHKNEVGVGYDPLTSYVCFNF